MTKAIAGKESTTQALPVVGGSLAKAMQPPALRKPPAKAARAADRNAAASERPPRPKQSPSQLENAIADVSGFPPKDVKRFLGALSSVAATSLRETNLFKLHGVVLIRMRKKEARGATTRSMFGKTVALPARAEGHKITAMAVKQLYDAVAKDAGPNLAPE